MKKSDFLSSQSNMKCIGQGDLQASEIFMDFKTSKLQSFASKLSDSKNITMSEYYKHFDYIPFAFFVMELVLNNDKSSIDFIFKYGNKALEKLENKSFDGLIGKNLYDIFEKGEIKWINIYSETAFNGIECEVIAYNPERNKYLKVFCFQPFYGHCACVIMDFSEHELSYITKHHSIIMHQQKEINELKLLLSKGNMKTL